MRFNLRWILAGGALCGSLVMLTQGLSHAQAPATAGHVRIGTYNTRAVALAYGRSKGFLEQADKLHKEGQEAKAKDDQKKLEQLKKEANEKQERIHAQVFSNAPIDNVIAVMKDALPGIARQAGVSAIVPQVSYHDPGVDVVDVTDAMVRHFQPTDKTLGMIKDLMKHPPVSYKELAEHKD